MFFDDVMMTMDLISSNVDTVYDKRSYFKQVFYLKEIVETESFMFGHEKHTIFNKGLCSFQETRDISPYRENSMTIVLVHSLASVI